MYFIITTQDTVFNGYTIGDLSGIRGSCHCRHPAGTYSDEPVLNTFDMGVLRAETRVGRTLEKASSWVSEGVTRPLRPRRKARRIEWARPAVRAPWRPCPRPGGSPPSERMSRA